MTNAYLAAFRFTVIGQEGGFVLSTLKHDSGGQTYAGISRVNFPEWEGWALVDAGDTTSDRLHDMVYAFYFNFLWVRMRLERLPARLGALVFDFAANSGRTVAAQKLQKVLKVEADGVIGDDTVRAATQCDWRGPIQYVSRRLDYLNDLKAWPSFSKGWSQRIVSVIDYACA